jgi:4-hydroxyproline epimerase
VSVTRLDCLDSHTEGEPTRCVLAGGPVLTGDVLEKARQLGGKHAWLTQAVCREPRGWEAMVGAHVSTPTAEGCLCDVVFFNTVGLLGMCGHGTMGVLASLAQTGDATVGDYQINTPVGVVGARLLDRHTVKIQNVRSFRLAKDVAIHVPGLGRVVGDVAYGGNWFFLVHDERDVTMARIGSLTDEASRIMDALEDQGVTGEGGAKIDHVELFGPPSSPDLDSRSFVLCPGKAYDRSPCGTGTSAKLACLAADGELGPHQDWRQESVTGGVFVARYEHAEDGVVPTIRGRAFVTARTELWLQEEDPLRHGLE